MNGDKLTLHDQTTKFYSINTSKPKNNASKLFIMILKIIFLATLFVIFIGPFFLILINSFKSTADFIANPTMLPAEINLSNYITAFKRMNFITSFFNSVVVTIVSCGLILVFSAMTAYLFVRHKSRFNNMMFYLMLASSIIPFQAIMIPLVRIYGLLHMLNNKWALIYMYIGFGTSVAVFIYHGFIKGIPKELEEAAMIDGCTKHQTFFKIVWPLLKPVTVTILLIDIVWIWNDYLLPYLVLQTNSKKTLPLVTYDFFSTYFSEYSLLMAGLMMIMLPVIVTYLFSQKYIIEGVLQGVFK